MLQTNRLPTEQEWNDWQDHPATIAQRKVLRQWISELKERWAAGAFTDMGQFGTAILNAKAVGTCEALDKVIGLEYEQLLGEVNDNNSQ